MKNLQYDVMLRNHMIYNWGKSESIMPFVREAIRLVDAGDPTSTIIANGYIYMIEDDYTPTAQEFVEHFRLHGFLNGDLDD